MKNALSDAKRRIETAVFEKRFPHAMLLKGDPHMCRELSRYAAALMFGKQQDRVNEVGDFYQIDGKTLKVAKADEILQTLDNIPASGKRLFVFSDAGNISPIVQNMLLKTIEEPPPDNYFVFYGNESGLLPTILSRCAHLPVGYLSSTDIAEYLTAKSASEDDAIYFAKLGGNIDDAIRLFEDEDARNYCYKCVLYICRLKKNSMFTSVQKELSGGEPLKCIEYFDEALSDMRRHKLGMPAEYFTRDPQKRDISECAERLTESEINKISELVVQMHQSLNTNSPASQVFDTFAAGAEQVIINGKEKNRDRQ